MDLHDWPISNAISYIEAADRLFLMAAQAQSPETRLQFERLAQLYEKLAAAAVRYHSDPADALPSTEAAHSMAVVKSLTAATEAAATPEKASPSRS